jgi:hypothetical protein
MKADNINFLPLPIGSHDPDLMLQKAQGQDLETVLIIGVDAEGLAIWFSDGDMAKNNLLIDKAKNLILDMAE